MLCSRYARPSGNWERDAMDCFNLSFLSTEHAGEPSWIGGTHSDLLPQLPREYMVRISQEQFKELPNHIFVSDAFGTQLLPQIYRISEEVRKLASSISLGV